MNKITDQDLANRGVIGLPDVPGLTTEEMQRKLEEIAREILVPKVNEIIENIETLNSNLNVKTYYDVRQLGITSWFIPDIIKAMPNNSKFLCDVGKGITSVADNKLPLSLGVLSIDKTVSRYRVIYNYSSDSSAGQIYIASVNVTDSVINGWYQLNVTAV